MDELLTKENIEKMYTIIKSNPKAKILKHQSRDSTSPNSPKRQTSFIDINNTYQEGQSFGVNQRPTQQIDKNNT